MGLSATYERILKSPHGSQFVLWLALWAFTACVLFMGSWDSYLFDLWAHYDTNWFMMCGKAWAVGLTPYVDFADSKGPLLWLIYSVGYLISPRDFTGVYWVSTVIYSITFFYSYKGAYLLTGNRATAVLVMAVMAFLFLTKLIHDETRAEDYCFAATMPVVYFLIAGTSADTPSPSFARRAALALGVCLGATLLIKYSVTLMLLVAVPYFLVLLPQRLGYSPWRSVAWLTVGAAVVVLPIVVLLAAQGCLDDMVNEYFLKTYQTIDNLQSDSMMDGRRLGLLISTPVVVYLVAIVTSVVIAICSRRQLCWPLLVALAWSGLVIAINFKAPFYLQSLAPLALPGVALAARRLNVALSRWPYRIAATVALVALMAWGSNKTAFFTIAQGTTQRVYYYYAALMAQYDQPRVLYLNCNDRGSSIPACGLPACKYWSKQVAPTPDMLEDQRQAVLQRRADVIIVQTLDDESRRLLEQNGYQYYGPTAAGVNHYSRVLYSRVPLDTVRAAALQVTPRDVLTKRRLFP